MTGPEEREQAKQSAQAALDDAKRLADRSAKIGERWRKSQQDNNFRLMLRQLGQKAAGSA